MLREGHDQEVRFFPRGKWIQRMGSLLRETPFTLLPGEISWLKERQVHGTPLKAKQNPRSKGFSEYGTYYET
jgi:hypothetical protein